MSRGISGKKLALFLAASVAAVILILALLTILFSSSRRLDIGQSADSRSSIGFYGLYQLVERTGTKATLHEMRKDKFEPNSLYLVADAGSFPWGSGLSVLYGQEAGQGVYVVFLGKWGYRPHKTEREWTSGLALTKTSSLYTASHFLYENLPIGDLDPFDVFQRTPWPNDEAFKIPFASPAPKPAPVGDERQLAEALGQEPISSSRELLGGKAPLQALKLREVETIVGANGLTVVGRMSVDRATLYLVSDPDLGNNMGLAQGSNAEFMMRLLEHVQRRENLFGPVRFVVPPSDIGPSSDFMPSFTPGEVDSSKTAVFVMTVISALILAAAVAERFGGVPPIVGEVVFGKHKLIDNGARLLAKTNRLQDLTEYYWKMTLARASKLLHAPRHLSAAELLVFLDRAAESRGIGLSLKTLRNRLSLAKDSGEAERLLQCAKLIHLWHKELSSGHQRGGRSSRQS
ncbi:MAG: hypothetical protein LBJ64_10435 [Deltaproteobacteria bacterium]|jgi:hypothetical protein|nr:hypothetical protein [Deltaproteobacteria bacterium]